MSLFANPKDLTSEEIESELVAARELFDYLVLSNKVPREVCEELIVYLDNLELEKERRLAGDS